MKEKFSTAKLLTFLFCCHVLSVMVTVVDGLFYHDSWLQWIQRGITVAIIVCLYLLGSESKLYRWTAVLKAVVLGITLVNVLLFTPVMKHWQDLMWIFTVLSALATVASYPSVILEYLGHGKMAPGIRKGWNILMAANLIWALLGSALSSYIVRQQDALNWSRELLDGVSKGMQLINLAFQLVYLWFLYRTIQAVKAKEAE